MAGKVTVIARWETSQMEPALEWRMWRQLKGAFGIDEFIFVPMNAKMEGYTFRQAYSVADALELLPADTKRVFLEPSGYNTMHEVPWQEDIALILGNTEHSNMEGAQVNETYRIATPGSTDLYGINAAAIALALRYGQ